MRIHDVPLIDQSWIVSSKTLLLFQNSPRMPEDRFVDELERVPPRKALIKVPVGDHQTIQTPIGRIAKDQPAGTLADEYRDRFSSGVVGKRAERDLQRKAATQLNPTLRTLTRICAPIFSSRKRIVPTSAWAISPAGNPKRRSPLTSV